MVSAVSFARSPWIGSKTKQAESLTVEPAQLVRISSATSKPSVFAMFQYLVYVFGPLQFAALALLHRAECQDTCNSYDSHH